MNSNDLPDQSNTVGRYVPYLYTSGQFDRYGSTRAGLQSYSPRIPRAYATYDFSRDQSPWPSRDAPQTVEQIIARGYLAIPPGSPETALLSDQKHVSGMGLDDVITRIRHRYEIYHQNIYELELATCEAMNAVHRQVADAGVTVANQRQMYAATKATQDIYEQKRDERVNLWRDVSRIRGELPETAQSYLAAHRKMSILEEGDRP